MILKELQNFVLKHHRVSLAELELHFHMDGDALRQMLKKLVQKGRIRQLPIPEHCEGCSFCNLKAIEFYEWIDEEDPQFSDSSELTKAQIHSTNVSEKEVDQSNAAGIKYAVILHDCQKNH